MLRNLQQNKKKKNLQIILISFEEKPLQSRRKGTCIHKRRSLIIFNERKNYSNRSLSVLSKSNQSAVKQFSLATSSPLSSLSSSSISSIQKALQSSPL